MPIGAMGYVALASAAASSAATIYGANRASNAARDASATQVAASDRAADLQYAASQDALAFQKQQWEASQTALQPYVQAGQGAVSKLSHLLGIGGVSPNGWTAQKAVASGGTGSLGDLGLPGASNGTGRAVLRDSWNDAGQAVLPNADSGPPQRGGATKALEAIRSTGYTGNLADLSVAEKRALITQATGKTFPNTSPTTQTTSGSTVTMRAGDGTTVQVNPAYAQYYEMLGYQAVSNG